MMSSFRIQAFDTLSIFDSQYQLFLIKLSFVFDLLHNLLVGDGSGLPPPI